MNTRWSARCWDQWFKGVEKKNLAFLYEDEKDSRFNKLIDGDKSR